MKYCKYLIPILFLFQSINAFSNEKNKRQYKFKINKQRKSPRENFYIGTVGAILTSLYAVTYYQERGKLGLSHKILSGIFASLGGALGIAATFHEDSDTGNMRQKPNYKRIQNIKLIAFANSKMGKIQLDQNRDYINFLKRFHQTNEEELFDSDRLNSEGVAASEEVITVFRKVKQLVINDVKKNGKLKAENYQQTVKNSEELNQFLNSKELRDELLFILGGNDSKYRVNFIYDVYIFEYYNEYRKQFVDKKEKVVFTYP